MKNNFYNLTHLLGLLFCFLSPLSILAQKTHLSLALTLTKNDIAFVGQATNHTFSSLQLAATCPAGRYLDAGNCVDCPPGSYCPGDDTKIFCATGTFASTQGASSCQNCQPGTYAPSVGSMSCTDCPTGKFSASAAASVCTDCAAGKYNDQVRQTECTDCPAGRFSTATAAISNSTCVNCAAGSYSASAGSSSCTDCEVGKFQPSTGETQCYSCSPGTYQNQTGKTSCIVCAVGTASGYSGGSAFCPPCAAGYYADFEGAAACQPCAIGKYQNSMGSTGCIDCPVGKYANAMGSTICTNCPSGYTTMGTGSDDASDCTVVLPLDMMAYKVWLEKDVVQIRWSTAQEKNLSFFVVQRSTDGKDWTTIARMNGKGNTQTRTDYGAADPFPAKGVNYYRIKAFDFDGTNHYSPIMALEMTQKTHLKVYPNPTNHQLNVAHPTEKIKSVVVFNMVGQLQMTITFDATHIGVMNLSDLPMGHYFLQVHTEGGVYGEKIVKY